MTSKSNTAMRRSAVVVVATALFVLLATLCFGQQITGTLSGTTLDASGAVIPNAKVTMANQASGDTRTSVSNSSGYFSITAIQPGSYTVTVTAPGFKTWQATHVVFSQGDTRTLNNISLQVGEVKETVEITAGALSVPTDNAEISTTLNETLVRDSTLVGRDAGELIKMIPGAAFANSGSQGSGFTDKVVGTNTGPVGAYSINGTQPNGAMAYMLDGANLVDPGNMGTQIANINQDMVQEVKVLTSSYSAEYAKGPVVFQAFGKSGGSEFHGEGYFYARNQALNSWDWYAKTQYLQLLAQGTQSANGLAQQLNPDQRYYYIGGNIGGPISFGGFNKSRRKLFFWAGYEYMNQHPAASALTMNVPTVAQKHGDFSNSDLTAAQLAGINSAGFGYAHNPLWSPPAGATGNSLPPSLFDPNITGGNPDGNHGILGLYPDPNVTPTAGNGWNNYQFVNTTPVNRWEVTGKVDYAISDNSKLSVSYSRQIEGDQHPVAIWWAPAWTLPYPSPITAATTSQVLLSNFTHVFNPTTTNEFVFTLARYINPSVLSNPSRVDRTKLGFNVQGLFGHTTKQIPNIYGPWGGAFPDMRQFSFDGGFQGNAFGGLKRDPALYDNFTKVVGRHTLKAGFYWDTSENIQSSSNQDNGIYQLGWGARSTGNVVADFLLGYAANYQQASSVPVADLKFHQWSIYGQDSFKVTRRLTVNYGLRFDHLGQWYGPSAGAQVWDPSLYTNSPAVFDSKGNCTANCNPGLTWYAKNHSIPRSGFGSPLFFYEPRVGLAYDLFGDGKTVLRAGAAVFRYPVSTEVTGAFDGPVGSFTYQANNITSGYAQIQNFSPPSSVLQNGAKISAMAKGDNNVPQVVDWNLTISRALPWRSVFEISYVGNKSTHQWVNGSNDKVFDANSVPYGGYFRIDPVTKLYESPNAPSCNQQDPRNNYINCGATGPNGVALSNNYSTTPQPNQSGSNPFREDHFRPLTNYTDIYILTHGGWANYNSLQLGWQKQSGPVVFLMNYSFSKVLGIRDGSSDNGATNGRAVDPFNFRANYGPLAYDHTHIVNFSGVWNLPKAIRYKSDCEDIVHCSTFLGGLLNGWQLSTYTTWQAGAPIQTSTGGNLNANFPSLTYPTQGAPDLPNNMIRLPNGLEATGVNPAVYFGTSQNGGGPVALLPTMTCDPRNHASGLYFNPNCFGVPAFGQQGAKIWPYLRNPAYFDSDLALFKNFDISERQKLQFRVSATNWLNHPLNQFNLTGNNNDQKLNFDHTYTVPISGTAASVGGGVGSECSFLKSPVDASGFCHPTVHGLSQTNTNPATDGKPANKTGSRFLTFSVKYFF